MFVVEMDFDMIGIVKLNGYETCCVENKLLKLEIKINSFSILSHVSFYKFRSIVCKR